MNLLNRIQLEFAAARIRKRAIKKSENLYKIPVSIKRQSHLNDLFIKAEKRRRQKYTNGGRHVRMKSIYEPVDYAIFRH